MVFYNDAGDVACLYTDEDEYYITAKNNDGADKDKSHTVILWKGKKNIPETLAFYIALRYNGSIRVATAR